MQIALAQEFLTKLGGAERVLKSMFDILPQSDIYTLFYNEAKVGKVFPKDKIKGLNLQFLYKVLRYNKLLLPFMKNAIEGLDFSGYDVVITSNTALMHNIIPHMDNYHISYIHSPARYIWDYYHNYKKDLGVFEWFDYPYSKFLSNIRLWDYYGINRVDKILCNSENVKKRIWKYYRKDAEVLYPPVRVKDMKLSTESEDYFLVISTLSKYKKIEIVIKAFNELQKKLIVIGDGDMKDYLENISQGNINFLGRIEDNELSEYLKYTKAVIYPQEEDFGIVPIEAMACGKPVIAYGKGGVLETVKENFSGEFFHRQTPESLQKAILKFYANEKNYNPKKIRESVMKFDESIFQDKILDIIRYKK